MNAHLRAGLATLILSILIYFGFRFWRSGADPVDQSIQAYQNLEAQGLPKYAFQDLEKNSLDLTNFSDGILIVTFWASWCGPCVEEFPSLVRLLELNTSIRIVAVSGDYKEDEIRNFLKTTLDSKPSESKMVAPKGKDALNGGVSLIGPTNSPKRLYVTWDQTGQFRSLFGVLRLPEAFIFLNGKLVRKVVGSINWAEKDALKFFSELKP